MGAKELFCQAQRGQLKGINCNQFWRSRIKPTASFYYYMLTSSSIDMHFKTSSKTCKHESITQYKKE